MIKELNDETKKSTSFIYTSAGGLSVSFKGLKVSRDAVKRGLDVRFLVHKDPKRESVYKKWKKMGVKIRYFPNEEKKSIRYTTFDGRIARITIGEPEIKQRENYLSFWIESSAFSLLLKDQFLEMWKRSKE